MVKNIIKSAADGQYKLK